MNRVTERRVLGVIVALAMTMLPGKAFAAATCSGWETIQPDGRINIVAATNANDKMLYSALTAGRSYCLEALLQNWGSGVSLNNLIFMVTTCNTVATPAAFVSRSTVSPWPYDSFQRYCFIAPSTSGFTGRLAVGGVEDVQVSLSETTLYNPRWSTYGGYVTSWGFQNTTATSLTGKLTATDGITTYTYDLTLPANSTQFVSTSSTFVGGTIGANKAGNAFFAHTGSPGAIVADTYLMGPDGTLVPGIFTTVRQNSH